jgi:hypothetical protein
VRLACSPGIQKYPGLPRAREEAADGIAYSLLIDAPPMILGVDGYLGSIDDILVGDHVEIVQ